MRYCTLAVLVLLAACGTPEAHPKLVTVDGAGSGDTGSSLGTDDAADTSPSDTTAACTSDKACKSQGLVCNTATGQCVACNGVEDCPAGNACKAHTCVPPAKPCASTKDCDGDQVCDKGKGVCVQCLGSGDCDAGQACVETVCTTQACVPGSVTCQAGSIHACQADGSGWTDTPCGTGEVCADGKCLAKVCEPGKAFCSGADLKTCDGTGTQASLVKTCGASESCLGGACVPQKCAPGKTTCADGSTLATCKTDGSGYDKSACKGGEVCDGDACKATVCAPGSKSCLGAKVLTCDATGLTQTPGEDCGASGKTCEDGGCLAQGQVCAPGSKSCDGTKLMQCKADGSGTTLVMDCLAISSVQSTCQGGACVPVAKVPSGFQVRAGFQAAVDTQGGGFRLSEQGWLSAGACKGSYCMRGGFQP
jgi:hypothetical protein